MPAFVRAVLAGQAGTFDEVALFEPDAQRRETTCRLSVELAKALGREGTVTATADVEEAFTDADFVFSAIRVGGDQGRVIDEQVALSRGLVGQETTGPGGCAMALRTIPVVLEYSRVLKRCSPHATLINFTNPAGMITQALSLHGATRAVGVCDTPSGALERLGEFLGLGSSFSFSYGGLNHLGWISSFSVDGEDRMDDLMARFEELQDFDHRFAAFDPALVRRLRAIPTEYVYYYYEPRRYVEGVARNGTSRGQDVLRLNEELLSGIGRAFAQGGVDEAWSAYSVLMGVRRDTYMRTDTQGASGQEAARAARTAEAPAHITDKAIGGYEGIAMRVIDGLTGGRTSRVIVNTRNGPTVPFLDPDDVVEVPTLVHAGGIEPLAIEELPRSARGLVTEVKEYERAVVDAAVSGDAGIAELALALHPLVPGVSVARDLLDEYRQRHGEHLAYLK
jgi:6-phospho-beta-glucosidase